MQTITLEREALTVDLAPKNETFALIDPLAAMIKSQPGSTFREKVWSLERAMKNMPQATIPVEHGFADGLYMRTIVFQKGTVAVGQVHIEQHVDVMLTGEMTILMDGGMLRVKAPHVGVTLMGGKKVGIAHEETRWLTVHANPDNCQDIPVLEARIAQTHELPEFNIIEVLPCP